MNRKYISLFSILAVFAISGAILNSDNVSAKEDSFQKLNFTVEMEDIFNMKSGQTMDLPVSIVNLDAKPQSVNIYITEQGNEGFRAIEHLAFEKSIQVSSSKSSIRLDATSSESEYSKSPLSVTVSIPEDTESGLYSYSLIVQKANDSHEYRKYFYINVE